MVKRINGLLDENCTTKPTEKLSSKNLQPRATSALRFYPVDQGCSVFMHASYL